MDGSESSNPGHGPTLGGSLRKLASTFLKTLHNRLELLGVELQEEKIHLTKLLVWIGVVLFSSFLTVISFTVTVVLLCPESARPYVLAGFGLLYGVILVWALVELKKQLRDRPPPLDSTVDQIKKDVAWIKSRP